MGVLNLPVRQSIDTFSEKNNEVNRMIEELESDLVLARIHWNDGQIEKIKLIYGYQSDIQKFFKWFHIVVNKAESDEVDHYIDFLNEAENIIRVNSGPNNDYERTWQENLKAMREPFVSAIQ